MKTAGMRQRERKKMAATFHGAGMVVPYDKKTIYIPDPDIIIARHFVGRCDIDFFSCLGEKYF